MGVKNKQRRQAKAKDRQRRARARSAGGYPVYDHHHDHKPMSSAEMVAFLVMTASVTCRHDAPAATDPRIHQLARLHDAVDEAPALIDSALTGLLYEQIDACWEGGWQPADIARVLRRDGAAFGASIAIDAMAAHLSTYQPSTVDELFPTQLTVLGADPAEGAPAGFVDRLMRLTGADAVTTIGTVFDLVDALSHLPELPRLCPPPGQASPAARAWSGDAVEPKLLERVRALLAKAESSEYGAEADALTAKAHELMTRHSIDQALLAASAGTTGRPTGQRIGLDNPYEAEKAALLDRIASANRCQAVWSRHFGFVTVLGYPADLRAVELLFTSLLVQSTRAMLSEGSRRTAAGSSRTRSFRQAFLSAFAVRIGERLNGVTESGIRESAEGDARLLPVLAGRRQAVRELTDEVFPELTSRERSFVAYDSEGWARGTHAADLATLTAIPAVAQPSPAAARQPGTQDPLFAIPH